MVPCKTVLDIRWLKGDPKSVAYKQKCIDFTKKMIIYGHFFFLYNFYSFVWIQHGCLPNTVIALEPSNSVIKRLCFIYFLFCCPKF